MWTSFNRIARIRTVQHLQNVRTFTLTRPLYKRISKIKLSELVLENESKSPLTPLERKEVSTGSIVLDTVREYTRKYPQCVLLVQVGDFYEVWYLQKNRLGHNPFSNFVKVV